MEWVTLERLESTIQGTFGRIVVGKKLFFTGELPWKNNESNISCIPTGIYNAVFTYSPRFLTKTYLLTNVKSRDAIRIHPANFMGSKLAGYKSQLNGCIALGEQLGILDRQKALLLSRPAVRKFEDLLGRKPFMLEIRDVSGVSVIGLG